VYGSEGAACLIVEVTRDRWIREKTNVLDTIATWNGGATAALARRLSATLESRDALLLEALSLELIGAASASTRAAPRWLARAHAFVHDEFRAIRSVAEIAAVAGVHPVHLARAYRARYGRSVAGELRQLRLQWAANELATTNRAIAEVALEAGFSEQSAFTRAFRAHFGVPPARHSRK
jgi:AraC family transcriptional regulator